MLIFMFLSSLTLTYLLVHTSYLNQFWIQLWSDLIRYCILVSLFILPFVTCQHFFPTKNVGKASVVFYTFYSSFFFFSYFYFFFFLCKCLIYVIFFKSLSCFTVDWELIVDTLCTDICMSKLLKVTMFYIQ